MSDNAHPPRRRVWKYVLCSVLACLMVLAALAWYTTTDSFQAAVHRRLVSEIERITGGRVELGALQTNPLHLRAEIRDLTIHGREAPGEVPYAHVGRLLAELKIISLLETEFGFNSVVLEHPVIHIVTYSDGSTNQPQPVLLRASGRNPIDDFRDPKIEVNYDADINLAEAAGIARRSELRRGTLQIGGRGTWAHAEFSSTGKLSVKDLDWREQPVGLHGASLN